MIFQIANFIPDEAFHAMARLTGSIDPMISHEMGDGLNFSTLRPSESGCCWSLETGYGCRISVSLQTGNWFLLL
jgi:hypothetical protein